MFTRGCPLLVLSVVLLLLVALSRADSGEIDRSSPSFDEQDGDELTTDEQNDRRVADWIQRVLTMPKRGLPMSGSIYGKRGVPLNGGLYGKRFLGIPRPPHMMRWIPPKREWETTNDGGATFHAILSRAVPMSGGMYGKRGAAGVPYSGGLYG